MSKYKNFYDYWKDHIILDNDTPQSIALDAWDAAVNNYPCECVKLRKENMILKTALEFYCNPENWKTRLHYGPQEGHLRKMSDNGFFLCAEELPVVIDGGKTAEKALKSLEGK